MVLQIGKYKVSDDLKTKQKENPMLAKDEVKNGERVTAIFPTVCGNIVIDTLADRTQTTISLA